MANCGARQDKAKQGKSGKPSRPQCRSRALHYFDEDAKLGTKAATKWCYCQLQRDHEDSHLCQHGHRYIASRHDPIRISGSM